MKCQNCGCEVEMSEKPIIEAKDMESMPEEGDDSAKLEVLDELKQLLSDSSVSKLKPKKKPEDEEMA